ncbi:MAG: hypothetical protein DMG78_30015, partial [Acidobacteria bacterium]
MWVKSIVRLLLATLAIPIGAVNASSSRIQMPVEVLGADGATANRTVALEAAQSESIRSLRLQVHGLRYPGQASVQVNASPWIRLTNDTVIVAT